MALSVLGSLLLTGALSVSQGAAVAPAREGTRSDSTKETRLVVVSPLLGAASAVLPGVPSIVSVGSTLLISRAIILPEAAQKPVFEGNAVLIDKSTEASAAGKQFVDATAEAVAPLAPVVNPMARPVGAAVIGVGAAALEAGGNLIRLADHRNTYPDYGAATMRGTGRALGFE